MTTGSRVSCPLREASEFIVCRIEHLFMTFPVESGCCKILQSGVIRIKTFISSFRFFRVFPAVALCGVLLAGCSSHTSGGATPLLDKNVHFKRIAMVPFQAVRADDPDDRIVRCPVSGATFRACDFSGTPEETIDDYVYKGLNPSGEYTLIPPREVRGIFRRVTAGSLGASPVEILQKVGREAGADGIIAGYLFCYRERKGFDYSVESPASVAFCIHLIRVEDGVSVWKGVFDKTQRSLLENILEILPFLRGGGKWMTAEELAREGVREILDGFPAMKGN